MELSLFHVDSFTSELFCGNPAAVMPLHRWIPDDLMQRLAAENNLSETAFFVPVDRGVYDIRWFTPEREIDLCGHATLASAAVIRDFLEPGISRISFHGQLGPLDVELEGDRIRMDFPSLPAASAPELRDVVGRVLGLRPVEVLLGNDLVAVLESESEVRSIAPSMQSMSELPGRGFLVTAPLDGKDFIVRAFFPKYGILEDPVTGSAYCALAPYWAGRLGKAKLSAFQASKRGGDVEMEWKGDRTWIAGTAVHYLRGTVRIAT